MHVDKIDSIFTRNEVRAVALAVRQAGRREVNCLAWEFEMDLRMTCDALESELGLKIKPSPSRAKLWSATAKPAAFLGGGYLRASPVYRG